MSNKKWLEKSEVQRLRKYCREKLELDQAHGRFMGIRNHVLIEFLLGTGFRASECRAVQIKDLNLNIKNTPYVKVKTLKRKKKIVDIVTIEKDLAKLIQGYIEALKHHGRGTKDNDYLFAGRNGRQAPLITVEKAVKSVFKRAGLPEYCSVHSLRHTHGFHLYQVNKNLKLVQNRLRHANIQTASIYTDVEPEEEQKTINGLYD